PKRNSLDPLYYTSRGTEPVDPVPGFLSTRYDLVEPIPGGAEARVYWCTRNGITTAVKVFTTQDTESQQRFARAVDLLRGIEHENVVSVLDAGISQLKRSPKMPEGRRLSWQLCSAMSFCASDEKVNSNRQVYEGAIKKWGLVSTDALEAPH